MKDIRTVTCWGDSLTESMRMADADRYPKVLNDYLGDVEPLLRRGVTFNPHEAYSAFKAIVLPLI